tara:strand:+ start:16920 stop:17474 length:555 start_codon:yes stop_codon:yes gene_type:complete
MKQSQRVRIFGGGFFIGCILAAGISLFRNASGPPEVEITLTEFTRTVEPVSLPELPFEHKPAFSTWISEESEEVRWLVPDFEGRLWRVSSNGEAVEVVLADRLRVEGNPGIESPALRAGLDHNNFEILDFNPHEMIFIVKINPFEPNSIEENLEVLLSRDPYIIGASPIPYAAEESEASQSNLD